MLPVLEEAHLLAQGDRPEEDYEVLALPQQEEGRDDLEKGQPFICRLDFLHAHPISTSATELLLGHQALLCIPLECPSPGVEH